MPVQSPRIDSRLLRALSRLDDSAQPMAETCRAVGAMADEIGITRPSYQQLRLYIHAVRRRRRLRESVEALLLDVWLRRRTPAALLEIPEEMDSACRAYDEGM